MINYVGLDVSIYGLETHELEDVRAMVERTIAEKLGKVPGDDVDVTISKSVVTEDDAE